MQHLIFTTRCSPCFTVIFCTFSPPFIRAYNSSCIVSAQKKEACYAGRKRKVGRLAQIYPLPVVPVLSFWIMCKNERLQNCLLLLPCSSFVIEDVQVALVRFFPMLLHPLRMFDVINSVTEGWDGAPV